MDALHFPLLRFLRSPGRRPAGFGPSLLLVAALLLMSTPLLAAGAEPQTLAERAVSYDPTVARREYPRVDRLEETLTDLINEARDEAGLAAVNRDEELDRVAAEHAREMAALRYFSHISPRTGGAGQRVQAAGYSFAYLGENLAGNTDVKDAHRMLMESTSHRGNILREGPVAAGIAVVRGGPYGLMIVELFLEPKEESDDSERRDSPTGELLASGPSIQDGTTE